jgi:two-component system, OmpR family, sensor kinase
MLDSIRVRLTLWYLLGFGSLLVGFSAYIYSSLARDLAQEFDTSLVRTAQSVSDYFAEFVERKNLAGGARETVLELQFERLGTAIYRDRQLLAANHPDTVAAIAATGLLSVLTPSGSPVFATDMQGGKRLVGLAASEGGVNYEVVVVEPLDVLRGQLARVRRIIFVGLPAALLLAAIGGYMLVRKSLQPVVTISEQAAHISVQNLDERLKITNPKDELGKLAAVFNDLLSRLEASFRIMREFMADASHELRTPLAVIQGESDVALSQDGTSTEYRGSLSVVNNQARRMARIVGDMLALARADAGHLQLPMEELYLNDLVEDCCRAAQALAVPKGVRLTYEGSADISFRGNEELLKRMAVNLLDNAIHYTPSGGCVLVRLASEPAWVRLSVTDTGIGIPPEHISRVFDRFYRVDESRARADGGSGLGLSIVKLAAESHQGSVRLTSELGRGSTFTVTLPLYLAMNGQG